MLWDTLPDEESEDSAVEGEDGEGKDMEAEDPEAEDTEAMETEAKDTEAEDAEERTRRPRMQRPRTRRRRTRRMWRRRTRKPTTKAEVMMTQDTTDDVFTLHSPCSILQVFHHTEKSDCPNYISLYPKALKSALMNVYCTPALAHNQSAVTILLTRNILLSLHRQE